MGPETALLFYGIRAAETMGTVSFDRDTTPWRPLSAALGNRPTGASGLLTVREVRFMLQHRYAGDEAAVPWSRGLDAAFLPSC
jgi:hypothetical protein